MENSRTVKATGGGEEKENSSRKGRFLDLQSIYNSRASKEDVKTGKKLAEKSDGEVRKGKKKRKRSSSSKKDDNDGSVSQSEPQGKKSRNNSDGENANGVRSRSADPDGQLLSVGQKLNSSNALIGISISLDQQGNAFRIPKRRRGSVRRKRFESDTGSKPLGQPSSVDQVSRSNGEVKGGEGDQVSKVSGSSGGKAGSSCEATARNVAYRRVKRKTSGSDGKKGRNSSGSLARSVKEEDGVVAVNNGEASSISSGSRAIAERVEPQDDDDEENLEQNAARMLSSRFDPRCTGFSSKTRISVSPSTNKFSFINASDHDLDVNSLAGSESPSADNSNRVLRPRKQHKGKGLSRKRRHYYEIHPRDLDVHWVLNRRIKVFWPLDKNWYYGLVSDYDPEKELHHIKYDDRDEEWINLRNEKFKLLLLPDEVPGKAQPNGSVGVKAVDKKSNSGSGTDDDAHMRNCLDTEPIISWLARSSRRVKQSPSSPMEKQKISVPPSSSSSLSIRKANDAKGDVCSLVNLGRERGSSVTLPCKLSDGGADGSLPEAANSSEVRKPVVYYRRRFRKKGENSPSTFGIENTRRSSPGTLTSLVPEVCGLQASNECGSSFLEFSDADKLLWLLDDNGALRLSMQLIESEGHRFEICLPDLLLGGHLFGAKHPWSSYTMSPSQYGSIITRWPMVILEMLFVDNIVGMRSLLFEGSLEHAVGFLFLILSVFNRQTEERLVVDLQLPVTSIRIKLSSFSDRRKQQVFAFYSFCKMKRSKWLFLDSKLQHHCLLTRQLPLSECTYDNIKALEGGSYQLDAPCIGPELVICEDLQKKSIQDVMPVSLSRASCSTIMGHSAFGFALSPVKLPPMVVSFAAAPTFFLHLHLKMLMRRSFACISLGDVESPNDPKNNRPTTPEARQAGSYLENDMETISVSDKENNMTVVPLTRREKGVKSQLEKVSIPVSDVGDSMLFQVPQRGEIDAEISAFSKNFVKNATEAAFESQKCVDQDAEQFTSPSQPTLAKIVSPSGYSSLDGMSVEIPSFDQANRTQRAYLSAKPSDLTGNMNSRHGSNTTGLKRSLRCNRSNLSSPLGDLSPVQPDGNKNMIHGLFSSGPKKPRTQVQYTMPFGGYDLSSKHKLQNQRSLPYKRIRRADDKRITDGSRSSQRNLEFSACDANVLVTLGDKGWRECGAIVMLELVDHNEWRLAVRLSGITRYSFKVNNILQPGSTNRYTHAMMWKGGKDWVLEFLDRSQWMLFKEMYEECYNRNVRAASVKNIPIPGVRLVDDTNDYATNAPFYRHSSTYFRQVENDVDMALNPARLLYDMDSEDEQWLSERRSICTGLDNCDEISDELFEKTMDMFEKAAYAQQRDHFNHDEIEELMVGMGCAEVAKVLYEHWKQKRQRNGMPLIRHLQPPLWEKYQHQLKQWEQGVSRANTAPSGGSKERDLEKPAMFAFCLKPRGLEIPNKGSKHRSQKKLPVSAHYHSVSGDQDGRRLNGFAYGDERVLFPGNCVDSSEASALMQTTIRTYSPRDASGLGFFSPSNDVSEWNYHTKFRRNKAKKIGGFPSPSYPPAVASYNQRTIGRRKGLHQWTIEAAESPRHKHYHPEGSYRHSIQQYDSSDVQEYRLRDVSCAAQRAQNMAKLKRERAQQLLYRADLAIHKAVVAVMTAEAIKAASGNPNGDG